MAKKYYQVLDLQTNKIQNVGAPSADTDAATKASAQAQANAAQAAAIAAAAADASTKASTAKTEAIAAAATDAASKANTALASANTYTDGKITALINSAPETLNTLGEIATALTSGASASAAIVTSLATKTTSFKADITGPGTLGDDGYEYTVAHNLNKPNIIAQAFEGNDSVDVFIRKVDNDTLKVITGVALGSTTLSIVVVG